MAAIALPKTMTSRTSVTGRAIVSSARSRSSWMIVCISCWTATGPPIQTFTGPFSPAKAGAIRSSVSPASVSSPPIRAAMSASRPSSARRRSAAVSSPAVRPPGVRSSRTWSANPASAKSSREVAASIGSSHSAAARAARCSWLVRNRSRSASCCASLAVVTSRKSHPTPSGTGSSASGEASRRNPLRQHRRRSPSAVRSVTQNSAGAPGAPSASTCCRAASSSSTPWTTSSPSGRPRRVVRPPPSAREAYALTTVGRRSTSTSTTPQDASSRSASLSAMARSRSIWACTSLNAQYTPAGLPSAPSTRADWVRTSTRLPSLRSSANSWTWRPGASMADMSRPCTSCASARRTAHPASPVRPRPPARTSRGCARPRGSSG
ncbi:hypothetical protein SMICM304S_00805 [Streptomyces microflavus]